MAVLGIVLAWAFCSVASNAVLEATEHVLLASGHFPPTSPRALEAKELGSRYE